MLLDETLSLSLKDLRKMGFFRKAGYTTASLTISQIGCLDIVKNTLQVVVNTHPENAHIELDYCINGKRINLKFPLIPVKSNLGRGEIWLIQCLETNKPCRKLYFDGMYFRSKRAIKCGLYSVQAQSKLFRENYLLGKRISILKQLAKQQYKPYFMPYYSGSITKKYKKIIEATMSLKRYNQPD